MTTEIRIYPKNSNLHISSHFSLQELKCKCSFEECQITFVCERVVYLLERLREKVCQSILITSGYRCPRYNKQIGGAPESQHITGYGVDLYVPGVKISKLAKLAKQVGFLGIGEYKAHIHVDIYKERSWTSEKS